MVGFYMKIEKKIKQHIFTEKSSKMRKHTFKKKELVIFRKL